MMSHPERIIYYTEMTPSYVADRITKAGFTDLGKVVQHDRVKAVAITNTGRSELSRMIAEMAAAEVAPISHEPHFERFRDAPTRRKRKR